MGDPLRTYCQRTCWKLEKIFSILVAKIASFLKKAELSQDAFQCLTVCFSRLYKIEIIGLILIFGIDSDTCTA